MKASSTSAALNAGARQRGADGGRAELRGREAGKLALERAHRSAGRADDDDRIMCHEITCH